MGSKRTKLETGEIAPDWVLPDPVAGQEVSLRQWQGGDVLLVFLRGTWCPFCREQLRTLTQSHGELEAAGVRTLAVVCQSAASVRRYLEANPVPFPVLVDQTRAVAKQYGVHYWLSYEGFNLAQPALFILDKDQRITFSYIGRGMRDLPITNVLERFVRLLKETKPARGAESA